MGLNEDLPAGATPLDGEEPPNVSKVVRPV